MANVFMSMGIGQSQHGISHFVNFIFNEPFTYRCLH